MEDEQPGGLGRATTKNRPVSCTPNGIKLDVFDECFATKWTISFGFITQSVDTFLKMQELRA
jgi:hypothetical protein